MQTRRVVALIVLLGLATGCSDDSETPAPTTTSRPETPQPDESPIEIHGIDVTPPPGWSVEPTSGDVLYLRNEAGAELQVLVQPVPSDSLGGYEVLRAVTAFGDGAAIVTEVEGGYALYAALDCQPEAKCDRMAVFGYHLSLGEFAELASGLG